MASGVLEMKVLRYDLTWYFLDEHGQEHGPICGSKLRQWMQSGSISQDFRVRLLNWDCHFPVEELWPSSEVAFVLPPDIYGSSARWDASNEGSVSTLERSLDTKDKDEKVEPKEASKTAVGSAKADVEREIALILATSPMLRRTDFDPMVRQHLHAFHGLGGAAQVREALQEVRGIIEGRGRQSVKSWPAYLYKLLKNGFVKAKDARFTASQRRGGGGSET